MSQVPLHQLSLFYCRERVSASCWQAEREFFIDNLPVQIDFVIVMIRWTGLAPWEFEFPFAGSLTSTFLGRSSTTRSVCPCRAGRHISHAGG